MKALLLQGPCDGQVMDIGDDPTLATDVRPHEPTPELRFQQHHYRRLGGVNLPSEVERDWALYIYAPARMS